jgi:hypothetical protein
MSEKVLIGGIGNVLLGVITDDSGGRCGPIKVDGTIWAPCYR